MVVPVRLVEIGASAGLNLRAEALAPIHRREDLAALPSGAGLRRADRLGCDLDPVDPTTTDGRLTLSAYVWPDDRLRFERLRAALDIAALVPAVVPPPRCRRPDAWRRRSRRGTSPCSGTASCGSTSTTAEQTAVLRRTRPARRRGDTLGPLRAREPRAWRRHVAPTSTYGSGGATADRCRRRAARHSPTARGARGAGGESRLKQGQGDLRRTRLGGLDPTADFGGTVGGVERP